MRETPKINVESPFIRNCIYVLISTYQNGKKMVYSVSVGRDKNSDTSPIFYLFDEPNTYLFGKALRDLTEREDLKLIIEASIQKPMRFCRALGVK